MVGASYAQRGVCHFEMPPEHSSVMGQKSILVAVRFGGRKDRRYRKEDILKSK